MSYLKVQKCTMGTELEELLRLMLNDTKFHQNVFMVGGYNRDTLLGIESKDIDIVVSIEHGAQDLTALMHEKFPEQVTTPYQLGAHYPIWQITFKDDVVWHHATYRVGGAVIEFADTMKESFPDDQSRQRVCEYGTLTEDVKRRDFTVNMLMKDVSTGKYVDLAGSMNDIKNGILRGHPEVSLDKTFSDDPLRMLRLIRFQCKFGWMIPSSVVEAVHRNAERIKIVSVERTREEMIKIMNMGRLYKAINLMNTTNLLRFVLPEVADLIGVTQSERFHAEGDVYQHTLSVLKQAAPTVEAQLAALLHDIGKPKTRTVELLLLRDPSKTHLIEAEAIHFLRHEEVGAEIAEAMLKRWKFDIDLIKRIKSMVTHHMRPYQLHESRDRVLRKFIRDIGTELVDAVMDLAEADAKGSTPVNNTIPLLRERVHVIQNSPVPVTRRAVLNGNEIMILLSIPPGRMIGMLSQALFELEDAYAEKGLILTKQEAEAQLLRAYRQYKDNLAGEWLSTTVEIFNADKLVKENQDVSVTKS